MRRTFYRFLAVLLTAGLGACSPVPEGQLRLFAAASLGDVAAELAETYRERHPETTVSINLAGSNVLARQIADGAAADVIISANTAWMDFLDRGGWLVSGSRKPLLGNRLVLVSARSAGYSLERIQQLPELDFRFLALANPEAVPAGIYARQYLASIRLGTSSLWQQLADRVAPAADVRRALAMAQADPSVIAVVYGTDAAAASDIEVLFSVPEDAVQIRYEAAVIASSRPRAEAQQFLRFLSDPAALAVYRRHGFTVAPSAEAGD